jgi:hypothetical protein
MKKFFLLLVGLVFCAQAFALEVKDVAAAKQEYERVKATGGEPARLAYVTKLARMFAKSLSEYMQSGKRKDDAALQMIDTEWMHNPMPATSDGKALSKAIVGDWNSPRRTYRFKANGSYGTVEDKEEVIQGKWRIKGNQLIEDDSPSAIVLLTKEYMVFSSQGSAFFHSRAK